MFKMFERRFTLTSDVGSFLMIKIWLLLRKKFEYPDSGEMSRVYNIVRKGALMLEKIKENPEKPDLLIRDVDWYRSVK